MRTRGNGSVGRLAVLVVVLAVLASGCFWPHRGRGGHHGDRHRGPRYEVFTGTVDEFYDVPSRLRRGRPGELIRVQRIGESDGLVSLRIMYHSRDARNRDRAVTGIVTYPTGRAPWGGWPVVSTAHGTTGLASQCAPSRWSTRAPSWGVDGVWVQSDYVGLGPVGEIHPYLSKASEGNAVIDAVRAARQLRDANAGRRWLSAGGSQGGHGALAAAELADDHAPELKLLGTISLAPAAMFDKVYGPLDTIVTNIITIMGLYGAVGEHPDVDPTAYVTPEVHAASGVIESGCSLDIQNALIPFAAAGPFTNDPRTTEPLKSLIMDNDVGHVDTDAPLFLASGTADILVAEQRVRDLFARLCHTGQVTELHIVDGADHGGIGTAVAAEMDRFIDDRLAGRPPIDSCAPAP